MRRVRTRCIVAGELGLGDFSGLEVAASGSGNHAILGLPADVLPATRICAYCCEKNSIKNRVRPHYQNRLPVAVVEPIDLGVG